MVEAAVTVDEYWQELVTTALLGTDRRPPPAPPPGPVADVVDDTLRPDGAARMLAAVGAMAASRRAAFVALDPADALQPPEHDDRPWCSSAAVATWRTIVAEWPELEDEWVLTLIESGRRLPPDALVELLLRHRNDVVRRARVAIAGGPVAAWVSELVPEVGSAVARTASAEAVASLPELAIPPELADLVAADAHTFVGRLMPGFEAGGYGPAHRAVLVNLLARCRAAVLIDTADALSSVGSGLAIALEDLCRLRHRMLGELEP